MSESPGPEDEAHGDQMHEAVIHLDAMEQFSCTIKHHVYRHIAHARSDMHTTWRQAKKIDSFTSIEGDPMKSLGHIAPSERPKWNPTLKGRREADIDSGGDLEAQR